MAPVTGYLSRRSLLEIQWVQEGRIVTESPKKHPCPDCLCCQWCSDNRCRMCLRKKDRSCRKLSQQEQIELYEKINKPSSGT
ncbi:MAG: hypothetical protein EG828_02015 [Deltaproteobacteria bacterium]|nr:hypothetical protein [Deltaproteobacteria bacterium]